MTKPRTVVYARVSLDQTGEGLAVERQDEACRQLARARGWTVSETIVDNSVSAFGKAPRKGFTRLVGMIERGEVDVVVAWAVDRLTRSLVDLERLIDLAERNSVAIATVSGDMDLSTDQGRMVARILASVARGEVERKATRQKAANLQAAKAGKRTVGRRPFGYEADGVTVRPGEADAIRQGYADLLAGVSLGQIARDWNDRGFVTGQERRGANLGAPSPWRRDSVRVVLANPRNAGQRWHLGEYMGPACWPAIVDEDTFTAAVGLLNDPRRMTGASNAKALLTGLARCGVCGATVHAGGGRGKGTTNYRCSGSVGHFGRKADPVDRYVGDVVVARLSRPDARELLIDRAVPDLAGLRAEATAIRARMDAAAVQFAEGDLEPGQLRIINERLREKLAGIEAKQIDGARLDMLGPLVDAADVRGTWELLSTDRKRAVIGLLMEVTILPPGRGVRTFDRRTVLCTPSKDTPAA
ncbi:MAG: site-specific recombinase [Pseudonocardiales bacterium]|jgi:DNA invertase Pin-like site-specific DNA recombinase|nr:site-specific recombinase [Pseudonocardiales bacterium]